MTKNAMLAAIAPLLIGLAIVASASAASESGTNGKALFEKHCAVCHPGGGNIINPRKPLDKKTMAANGIQDAEDIIATLRNPGPGMTPFGEDLIPDEDAKKIADYILQTF